MLCMFSLKLLWLWEECGRMGGCSQGVLRQPPGYGSGQAGGSSGDVHSSVAVDGGSPISLCGRPHLPWGFIS